MGTATTLVPRFHTGDRVTIPTGFRRAVAQVVEDRGLVGSKGRRIFQVQIDQNENGTTTEVPEAELQNPPDITTAETARQNGFSTEHWPRQGFHASYSRSKDASVWNATLTPVHLKPSRRWSSDPMDLSTPASRS